MTRPPWSGFAVADDAAVALGSLLAVGPPGVHAVATSIVVAKTAMRTRPVRCFAVMYPPLAPFGNPRTVAECIQRHTLPLHLVYTGEPRRPFTFGSTTAGRRRRAKTCSG